MSPTLFSYFAGFWCGVVTVLLIRKVIRWLDDYLLRKNEEAGSSE